MFRTWRAALAVLCVATPALLFAHHDSIRSEIHGIVQELASISGLNEQHQIPYGRMNKHQLRKFLSKRIKKTLKPDEIRADELALKMFGLVPQNFDLRQSTLDLLTEQAAAFYDYDKKKLFLLEGSSFTDEKETLAHELSHGLADQHFDLEKYIDETSEDSDANLARTAVVEGQASWLMLAYMVHGAPDPKMVAESFGGQAASMAQYPVLKSSPLYIQQSLLFPYEDGALFFDAVYRRDGKKAFAEVFQAPPSGTAQILHPDRYFDHQEPTKPALPANPADGKNPDIDSEGPVGEFDHKMLLWQYFDEAEAKSLSPHVLGGDYRIVIRNSRPVLRYASEWDSTHAAERFFSAYQHVIQQKSKGFQVLQQTSTMAGGKTNSGYFVVRLDGPYVRAIEAIPSEREFQELTRP